MNQLTFIITNYNYSQYLLESINSLLPFLSSKYKCIVIDDGSTDESLDLLAEISNDNISVIKSFNCGLEVASNLAILHSNSKYICRLDADDKLLPEFFSAMLPHLNSSFDVLYGDYRQINSEGCLLKVVKLPEFNVEEIYCRGDFLATGTIIKRKAIANVGYFPVAKRNCGLENYEVMIKLIQNGCDFKKFDEFIFEYRIHSESIGQNRQLDIIEYGQNLAQRLNLTEYKTNQFHPYGLVL